MELYLSVAAFTCSANAASQKVLLGNGFREVETFWEDGVESKYFQTGCPGEEDV